MSKKSQRRQRSWWTPPPLAVRLLGPWFKNENEEKGVENWGMKMSVTENSRMKADEMNTSMDVLIKQKLREDENKGSRKHFQIR